MTWSAVGKFTGLVEGATGSLIQRALNSTDYLFPKRDNPIVKIFFESVHAVDKLKEYKTPILATAGCCIIGAGSILADTPGAIAGFLATVGTTLVWNALEDQVLTDKIVQYTLAKFVNLEKIDEQSVNLDFVIEELETVVLKKTTIDDVQQQALLQARELATRDLVLSEVTERAITMYETLIKNRSLPLSLRTLAWCMLIEMQSRASVNNNARDKDWIEGILRTISLTEPGLFRFDDDLQAEMDGEEPLNDRESTEWTSVHISVAESLEKLQQRYQLTEKDFGSITKEIRDYMYERSLLLLDKDKIHFAQSCFEKLAGRLAKARSVKTGMTIEHIMALVWSGINDCIEGKDLEDRKTAFVRALAKLYNEKGPACLACNTGVGNTLVEVLDGTHPDVKIVRLKPLLVSTMVKDMTQVTLEKKEAAERQKLKAINAQDVSLRLSEDEHVLEEFFTESRDAIIRQLEGLGAEVKEGDLYFRDIIILKKTEFEAVLDSMSLAI